MARSDNEASPGESSPSREVPEKSPERPGLPAKTSVLSEKVFISPKLCKYRIIKTDETDATDEKPKDPAAR